MLFEELITYLIRYLNRDSNSNNKLLKQTIQIFLHKLQRSKAQSSYFYQF